jgi:hypothetical protein
MKWVDLVELWSAENRDYDLVAPADSHILKPCSVGKLVIVTSGKSSAGIYM